MSAGDPIEARRRSIDLLDYWTPLMLRAVIEAGVVEALGQGRRTVEEVAAETGALASTLARVLRALAGRGIVHAGTDGGYELTPIGEPFLVAHPDSRRGLSSLPSFELHAWAEFEHTLFTGEVAFNHHYGKSFFEWLAENPDRSARFDGHIERRTAALLKTANPLAACRRALRTNSSSDRIVRARNGETARDEPGITQCR